MRRIGFFLGLLLSLFMISASGCEKMDTEAGTVTEDKGIASEGEVTQMQPQAELSLATVVIGGAQFSVEVASTDEQKAAGLSGRESLPEKSGMWFVFNGPTNLKFWMKGMRFPLDMIFVGEDMKVVQVFENVSQDYPEMIGPATPYKFVIELNAGAAAKHGIKAGDMVEMRLGPG